MANSTTNLDTLVYSQASKEVTANAVFDAVSPATLFGRRASTSSALTWGYYGGTITVDGVLTQIANGTLALTASATCYVEADRTGTVSFNTTGFTPGRTPLYQIVTGTSSVTSYTDYRVTSHVRAGRLVKAMADANQTLAASEARNNIIEATGALTALRNVVLPLGVQEWTVFANTTGGFGVQFIGATGTGVTVADGKRARIYADGTNIVRATADI